MKGRKEGKINPSLPTMCTLHAENVYTQAPFTAEGADITQKSASLASLYILERLLLLPSQSVIKDACCLENDLKM